MKKNKVGSMVTLVIAGLSVMLVLFIVFSYIEKRRSVSGSGQQAGGQRSGQQVGASGQQPGGQGSGQQAGTPGGGQQTGAPASGQQAGGQRNGQQAGAPASGQQAGGQRSGQQAGAQGSGQQAGAPASGQQGGARPTGGGAQGGAAPGQGAGQTRTARAATAVRVTPVDMGTIENSVIINGDVLARTQISIYPTVGGKVTELRLQIGDSVRQGQIVAMVDPSKPGEVYSQSPVISPISGTVLSVPVNRGDTLSTQTAVYVVGNLSSLLIETFVPERFSNSAKPGLPAQVSLEALPGEIFNAVVEEVSPVLDPASRTLKIRLRFNDPSGRQDPRIRAGMFAMVNLVTNTKRDIPVIPRSAVINTYGSWIVFTVNEQNIAKRREISLGLENEAFIEVISGLELGELVVSAGQNFLSDNDSVRIVK